MLIFVASSILPMVKPLKEPVSQSTEDHVNQRDLLLHNDDVNTFEFIISSLIEVCNHEPEQAEQCALIAHYKGKCVIKTGDYFEVKPPCDELTFRGITVSIE
jgi:ATP-dependent Clp protease adaptor protein ClpS